MRRIAIPMTLLAYALYRRARMWLLGKPADRFDQLPRSAVAVLLPRPRAPKKMS